MTRLSEALKAAAADVNEALEDFLPKDGDGAEGRLFDAMRYSSLAGGKRLRAFLALTSADLFDVPRKWSLRAAVAVELVHTYSLVHDDLPAMDDDDLRRGQPTCHKRYDEATAILVGDALQVLAFEILSSRETHPDASVRCELVYALGLASGVRGMVGGQMIDLYAEHQKLDIAAVTHLQLLKTGALIGLACESGAILGQAPEQSHQALKGYAHDLGLAFQIADDLLDLEGSEAELGKAVGKDALAGKATFLSILGPERARQHAHMLVGQAIEHLGMFGGKAERLRQVARYVVERRH